MKALEVAFEVMARFSFAMPLFVVRMRLSLRTAIARCTLITKGRDVQQHNNTTMLEELEWSRFGEKIMRLVVNEVVQMMGRIRPSLNFLVGSHGSSERIR